MDTKNALNLVATGKLSSRQLLKIGHQAGDKEVWEELLKEIDFGEFDDSSELIDIESSAKCVSVWKQIAEEWAFTPYQLLHIGREANDKDIWKIIISKIDFSQFSYDDLMVIGDLNKNWKVWIAIVEVAEKINLTVDQLLRIGLKTDCEMVWAVITEKIEKLPQ
jgi:hypothetical protein